MSRYKFGNGILKFVGRRVLTELESLIEVLFGVERNSLDSLSVGLDLSETVVDYFHEELTVVHLLLLDSLLVNGVIIIGFLDELA